MDAEMNTEADRDEAANERIFEEVLKILVRIQVTLTRMEAKLDALNDRIRTLGI